MNQSMLTNEIICDNILRKFNGNVSYTHTDVRRQNFYENIDPDYTIVEDHINFLLRDRTLKETPQGLSLTTKGWFILTNADRVGYVAQRIESVRKEQVERETRALFRWTTVIVGFVLMGLLTYKVIQPELF
ncbi:MAG TPA: hypothetical protein VK589_14960 [Chryseolinea sp.]|nr:hypothetical protein [Chryseolinea sp.]